MTPIIKSVNVYTLLAIATLTVSSMFSASASAADEPVSYQTELVGNQSIYAGFGSYWINFRRKDVTVLPITPKQVQSH